MIVFVAVLHQFLCLDHITWRTSWSTPWHTRCTWPSLSCRVWQSQAQEDHLGWGHTAKSRLITIPDLNVIIIINVNIKNKALLVFISTNAMVIVHRVSKIIKGCYCEEKQVFEGFLSL